jgi:hypothetical protein
VQALLHLLQDAGVEAVNMMRLLTTTHLRSAMSETLATANIQRLVQALRDCEAQLQYAEQRAQIAEAQVGQSAAAALHPALDCCNRRVVVAAGCAVRCCRRAGPHDAGHTRTQ